jgi:hypothetical protein
VKLVVTVVTVVAVRDQVVAVVTLLLSASPLSLVSLVSQ